MISTRTIYLTLFITLLFSCKINNKKEVFNIDNTEKNNNLYSVAIKQSMDIKKNLPKDTLTTYVLKDLSVKVQQKINETTSVVTITILKNGKNVNHFNLQKESVGGDYGVSKGINISNHLIFSLHGDYDGRTLIINDKGESFNIIGGRNYLDNEKDILFTNYESDLTGFAVFDLKTDSLLLELTEIDHRPHSFHKAYENRYFIYSINDGDKEKSIWEIELDLSRIMQVELDENNINSSNQLKEIIEQ